MGLESTCFRTEACLRANGKTTSWKDKVAYEYPVAYKFFYKGKLIYPNGNLAYEGQWVGDKF